VQRYKSGLCHLLRFGWCKAAALALGMQWKKHIFSGFFSTIIGRNFYQSGGLPFFFTPFVGHFCKVLTFF
jgi:hypothetical protein